MTHCYACGCKLENRFLEHEGDVPYCPTCDEFRFPIFNCAVSMLVLDETEEHILLIQQYGRQRWILVAGYVNRGETAEQALHRELMEEVGLEAESIRFNKSSYFEKSNSLIFNFKVKLKPGQTVKPNWEIDAYQWYTLDEARKAISPGSLAEEFFEHCFGK